jgi:hypothetical protein
VFLGHGHNRAQVTEAPPAMTSPLIFLACLCLLFGIGAFALPLKYFILPSVSKTVFIGFFMPSLAAGLLLLGLIIGLAIYLLGTLSGKRTVSAYIGGELLDENMVKVPGTSFYHHIRHTRRIGLFVRLAEAGWFNLYTFFEKVIYTFARGLKFFHSGNLAAYMLWLLSGFMAIAYILFR